MRPSIGRIVHYTNLGDRDGKYPPTVQAAIITGVEQHPPPTLQPGELAGVVCEEMAYKVSLHVFYKTGAFDLAEAIFTKAIAGSEEARGKWSWPVAVLSTPA